MANVHHLLGDYRTALKVARRAREIHPEMWLPVGCELTATAALGDVDDVLRRATQMADSPADAMGWSPAQAIREGAEELWGHGYGEAARQLWGLAIEWYDLHESTGPLQVRDQLGRSYSLYALGRYDEAMRAARVLQDAMPQEVLVLGLIGRIAARQGDFVTATDLLGRLEEMGERPYQFGRPGYQAALIAAVLGDDERTLQLLRRAKAQGLTHGHWVHREMDLDGLRGTPAFQALARPVPANTRD